MVAVDKISIVYLVTRVCLTSAILTAKASSDPTNVSRPWHSYLPTTSTPVPKHPNHQHDDRSISADLTSYREKLMSYREHLTRLQAAISILNNRKQKSQTGPQRFPTEIQQDDFLAKVPNASPSSPPSPPSSTTPTTLSESRDIREYQRHIPRRFAYQDIEVPDRYLTAEPDDDKLPYRGKAELSTYYRREPQLDLTAAIKILDRFLSRTLNDDSYNSKLHPPPNPVLALVLSRYGRYVPGTRNPRVYAYMAANNIHNNLPFGRYKYEREEEPIYSVR